MQIVNISVEPVLDSPEVRKRSDLRAAGQQGPGLRPCRRTGQGCQVQYDCKHIN